MHAHKYKEPAYLLLSLPCCPNLSNEALFIIARVSLASSCFTNPSWWMTVLCLLDYIPWSSQVHLMLVGIIFVGVLYGIMFADLGATTEPGVPCGVCCSHMVVLLGACRRRGTCYHDPSWTHTSELSYLA